MTGCNSRDPKGVIVSFVLYQSPRALLFLEQQIRIEQGFKQEIKYLPASRPRSMLQLGNVNVSLQRNRCWSRNKFNETSLFKIERDTWRCLTNVAGFGGRWCMRKGSRREKHCEPRGGIQFLFVGQILVWTVTFFPFPPFYFAAALDLHISDWYWCK